jgi:uncharacterized Ntn-hydrolase superfamily protein
MKPIRAVTALALLTLAPLATPPADARDPFVSTYSIVAKDPETGAFGVAVQSHWFQVGLIVAWAEAGVGAVATQSFVEPSYGPRGLTLMGQGVPAEEALGWLTSQDENRQVRQVAMVDAKGRVAAWTGESCIEAAGHVVGEAGEGFSVQANLMDRDTVPRAMAAAYRKAVADGTGDFAERLLLALEAAQGEGGDIRGRQSAALLVVAAEPTGQIWRDRLVDLRIADHPEPLHELRRLLTRHRAYERMNAGDEAMAGEDFARAEKLYSEAAAMAPEVIELPFWKAVTLYTSGQEEAALEVFRQVFASDEADRWKRLIPRLPAAGLLPDQAAVEEILKTAASGAAADRPPGS